MSWNIKVIGSPAEVKAYVLADINTPQGVKDVIASICSEPDTRVNGIRVEGYGHSGGGYGSICKLEVERVHILPEPISPCKPFDYGPGYAKSMAASAAEPVLADPPKDEAPPECPVGTEPKTEDAPPPPAGIKESANADSP